MSALIGSSDPFGDEKLPLRIENVVSSEMCFDEEAGVKDRNCDGHTPPDKKDMTGKRMSRVVMKRPFVAN